jgi:lipid II:glycine glycyltransferase (peptidoglycan interpeptide bridge formation enzyme)
MEKTNFLQSKSWGEFQKTLGNKVITVSTDDGTVQYYFVKSKFANFLYCPRGPLVNSAKSLTKLLDQQVKDAKEIDADFILIEPSIDPGFIVEVLLKRGFAKQKKTTQPENTSIVYLIQDNEVIYSNFRKTTRQMIRKALENKVEIKSYQDLSRWDDFAKLFMETTQRQKFTPHNFLYMQKQFECFKEKKNIKLYLAESDGKVLAGAIILSYGKTSTYLHAGSNNLGRDLGAAQLLVWTAIQDSKKEGNEAFDLWGIAPENEPSHPWFGITIFKKGFGGETVTYPGAFVLPVNINRYRRYLLINFLRAAPPFKTAQRILLRAITKG